MFHVLSRFEVIIELSSQQYTKWTGNVQRGCRINRIELFEKILVLFVEFRFLKDSTIMLTAK